MSVSLWADDRVQSLFLPVAELGHGDTLRVDLSSFLNVRKIEPAFAFTRVQLL